MDLNFEQLLAEHNQNFKESEVYSDWMPDDGEYIATLLKLAKGTTTKNGVSTVWWRLTGRIEDVQDEKINGREFSVGYYTSKAFGILKGAVNVLSGQSIDDLGQAHAILEAAIGLVLRVKVRTSRSKKDGKDYTNCYILEVINTTTEASAVEAPDGADPGGIAEIVDVAPEVTIGDAVDSGIPAEVPAEAPVAPIA